MPHHISIIAMTAADLDPVAAIEQETASPWSREQLAAQIGLPVNWQFAAHNEKSKVIGYICGRSVAGEAEIFRVAVDKRFRRLGAASRLLQHALEMLRKTGITHCYLEVRESNRPALLLYAGAGFQVSGNRRGYYENPREDAVLMAKKFDKE